MCNLLIILPTLSDVFFMFSSLIVSSNSFFLRVLNLWRLNLLPSHPETSSVKRIGKPFSKIINIMATINIGDRQKGRQTDKTIINVSSNLRKFKLNLEKALKKKVIKSSSNFYGFGKTIQKQVKIINKIII